MPVVKSALFANIVALMHAALVVFFLYSPFSPYPALWVLSTVSLIFVVSHWCIGEGGDVCALTLLERYLRGCDSTESFMHQIVSPVYKFVAPDGGTCTDSFTSKLVWATAIFLILVGLWRISFNFTKVKKAFMKTDD